MGEARSNTYLGIAALLLTVSSGIDLALAIWAETDEARHLWREIAFDLPFAFIASWFAVGAYVLVALFKALPLPTLLHERDAARQREVRQHYAQLIFEGVCIANTPLLGQEQLQEFINKASNFTSQAFAHEQLQIMSKQALTVLAGGTSQSRQALLESYIDRMSNILDRQAPVTPGFSVAQFETSWKRFTERTQATPVTATG